VVDAPEDGVGEVDTDIYVSQTTVSFGHCGVFDGFDFVGRGRAFVFVSDDPSECLKDGKMYLKNCDSSLLTSIVLQATMSNLTV
jgi:hypothetical protein